MNYSHDTEMDRDWAADQLRRKKNALSGLPDSPIRRTAAALPQVAVAAVQGLQGAAATPPGAATLGNALSALAINAGSAEHVQRICHGLLALLYDKECLPVHQEFAQLKGVEALLAILRRHGGGTALAALRVLEKSRSRLPFERELTRWGLGCFERHILRLQFLVLHPAGTFVVAVAAVRWSGLPCTHSCVWCVVSFHKDKNSCYCQ
ncbi:unnamed protein product [Symbiodinium necroappetens]|uniref:Uncharacterized protein n=1 Tax=Symbiodinium necroappetens TaxID=1628268 RepID=A0A812VG08_9DINO|nr:unnamed protein product [Symbiodinium necroappetens]